MSVYTSFLQTIGRESSHIAPVVASVESPVVPTKVNWGDKSAHSPPGEGGKVYQADGPLARPPPSNLAIGGLAVRKALIVAVLGGYCLALLDLTLLRFPQFTISPNWTPFETISHYLHIGGWEMAKNLLGNIIVFMPLGFLLPCLDGELRSAVLVTIFALSVSLLIESLQYVSGQRVADVDDVLLNTLGGFLGYVAFAAIGRTRLAGALARAES